MDNYMERREFVKNTGSFLGASLISSGVEENSKSLETEEDQEKVKVRATIIRDRNMFNQDTFVLLKKGYEDPSTGMATHPVSETPENLKKELCNNIGSKYEFEMREIDWQNLSSAEYENNSDLPEYSQKIEEWWSTRE